MKPIYLLAAAAMLVSGTAQAQTGDWRNWGTAGEGDKSAVVLVDPSTLETIDANTRQVATTSVYGVDQSLSGDPYRVLWIRYRFDCKARTYQITGAAAWYHEKLLLSSDTVQKANPTTAGSLMDQMLDAACQNTLGRAPKIGAASPEAEGRSHFGQ